SGANLRGADLSGANLSGANLRGADLSSAKLRDRHWGLVRWDEGTKWEGVKGLETATGVPAALRQQLGLPESQ
ncbi:pentapeptide repeat-containing protein, partial [Prochlorothrix hollandica]